MASCRLPNVDPQASLIFFPHLTRPYHCIYQSRQRPEFCTKKSGLHILFIPYPVIASIGLPSIKYNKRTLKREICDGVDNVGRLIVKRSLLQEVRSQLIRGRDQASDPGTILEMCRPVHTDLS